MTPAQLRVADLRALEQIAVDLRRAAIDAEKRAMLELMLSTTRARQIAAQLDAIRGRFRG